MLTERSNPLKASGSKSVEWGGGSVGFFSRQWARE